LIFRYDYRRFHYNDVCSPNTTFHAIVTIRSNTMGRKGSSNMKKVLVVDDEDMFREMVIVMLKTQGYKTMEADSGLSAFELAKANVPDLIVSDVMMYSGSGFILREFLKREPRTAKIPLILMSGQAQVAGAWGSDPDVEYLAKPFTQDDLMTAVDRLLKQKKKKK
jgi:CheY-like chemotaxis protein